MTLQAGISLAAARKSRGRRLHGRAGHRSRHRPPAGAPGAAARRRRYAGRPSLRNTSGGSGARGGCAVSSAWRGCSNRRFCRRWERGRSEPFCAARSSVCSTRSRTRRAGRSRRSILVSQPRDELACAALRFFPLARWCAACGGPRRESGRASGCLRMRAPACLENRGGRPGAVWSAAAIFAVDRMAAE